MPANPSFRRRRCQTTARLTKTSFIAQLTVGSSQRAFYEGLPDENWEILSFDPATRLVCVTITNRSTTSTTTVRLPDIVFN